MELEPIVLQSFKMGFVFSLILSKIIVAMLLIATFSARVKSKGAVIFQALPWLASLLLVSLIHIIFHSCSSSMALFLLLNLCWVCFPCVFSTAGASGCVYPSSPRYHLHVLHSFSRIVHISNGKWLILMHFHLFLYSKLPFPQLFELILVRICCLIA